MDKLNSFARSGDLTRRIPEPPLWPSDPGERSLARLLVFRFDELSRPYYALRREEEGAQARDGYSPETGWSFLAGPLAQRAGCDAGRLLDATIIPVPFLGAFPLKQFVK